MQNTFEEIIYENGEHCLVIFQEKPVMPRAYLLASFLQ